MVKRTAIKRVHREKRKTTTQQKVLGALGVGSTLVTGVSGVAVKPPQTQFVRVQNQLSSSRTSKVLETLKSVFGVGTAHASELDVQDRPVILTSALADAVAGNPYQQTLTAFSTQPLTWSVSGQLPQGLTLDPAGMLSGVPVSGGSYSFTATVTPHGGGSPASRTYSLTVHTLAGTAGTVAPSVTNVSDDGEVETGEEETAGQTQGTQGADEEVESGEEEGAVGQGADEEVETADESDGDEEVEGGEEGEDEGDGEVEGGEEDDGDAEVEGQEDEGGSGDEEVEGSEEGEGEDTDAEVEGEEEAGTFGAVSGGGGDEEVEGEEEGGPGTQSGAAQTGGTGGSSTGGSSGQGGATLSGQSVSGNLAGSTLLAAQTQQGTFQGLRYDDLVRAQGGQQAQGQATGATQVTQGGTYRVRRGDTLWDLAMRFYGDHSKWTVLRDANAGKFKDQYSIPVGLVLTVPGVNVAAEAAQTAAPRVRTQASRVETVPVTRSAAVQPAVKPAAEAPPTQQPAVSPRSGSAQGSVVSTQNQTQPVTQQPTQTPPAEQPTVRPSVTDVSGDDEVEGSE